MHEFWMFPGQGYQHEGMLKDVPSSLINKVENLTGIKLLDTTEAYQDSLQIQLGILILQIYQINILKQQGFEPTLVSGHSLGIFAAAYAANIIKLDNVIRLVYKRATLMKNSYPQGYGMGVIVGLTSSEVTKLVNQVNSSTEPVYASNQNAELQIAISGKITALNKVIALAKANGAQKAQLIKVPVPSHSPLMIDVAKQLSDFLKNIPLTSSSIRYLADYNGTVVKSLTDVRYDLGNNLVYPVYWNNLTNVALEFRPDVAIEFSPGHAFSKLIKTKTSDIKTLAIDDYGLSDSLFLLNKWKRG